jgi:dihydroorotate dehydrogenase
LSHRYAFSVASLVTVLLQRQQKIIDGTLKANSRNLIGVNLMANLETQQSVPYITHTDFTKGIRELSEVADYVVLNLTYDLSTSGLQQYYKNPNQLNKLLSQVNKARVNELGKIAAHEYEKFLKTEGLE